MSKQLYFKPSNAKEADKDLSLRGLTLNKLKKAFLSLVKFKGRLKNKKIKTEDVRQAIGTHFGDRAIDKQGLEKFFDGFCKEKNIQLEKDDLTKMLGCFEREWDGKYRPDQLIRNLVNYTYEDFLSKKYERHNPKPYPEQTSIGQDKPEFSKKEMRNIARKVDDLLFISAKDCYKLYKEVDRNKDGHVCKRDLEDHLRDRLNLGAQQSKAFVDKVCQDKEILNYNEFHSLLFPGFSQKDNYKPGTKFNNVLGLQGSDANTRIQNLTNDADMREKMKDNFRLKDSSENCRLISLLLWR